MTHAKYGWAWAAGVVTSTALAVAHAAPSPVVIATCGDSAIDATAGEHGGTATLHGVVASATGERWGFSANVGLARLGGKTRTITVEEVHTLEGTPIRKNGATPSGLIIDLWPGDKKVILRHASEGGGDPDYAVDLDRCSLPREGDGALAALVPPPPEPLGCAPDAVRGSYRTQVDRAARLPDAEAEREARALCEDHQTTIEARERLERAIADRAARDRITARGAAVMKAEDTRLKAWNRIDGCLGAEPSKAHGIAALHEAEVRTRACYAKIAARP
jgi:hypothetical protein